MSSFRYRVRREQMCGNSSGGSSGSSSAPGPSIEKREVVKRHNLIESFRIREIARRILSKKKSEDVLSEEILEFIALNCFRSLAQVLESGKLLMRQAHRNRFTMHDFRMGAAANNPSRVDNIPSPFILFGKDDESSDEEEESSDESSDEN